MSTKMSLLFFLFFGNHVFAEIKTFSPQEDSRPFRSGYLNLSTQFNDVKPLAESDYSGFVFASGLLIGAVDDSKVIAYSVRQKKIVWSLDIVGGLTVPPKIVGTAVLLSHRQGELLKVEVASGRELWRVALDSFVARRVIKKDHSLWVVTAHQSFYNLDFETGSTRWVNDEGLPTGMMIRSLSAPVSVAQLAVYGLASGEFVGLVASTGKVAWRFNPAVNDKRFHDVVGDLAVFDSKIIATRYDGVVVSFSAENTKQSVKIWSKDQAPWQVSTSAFREGRLFIGTVAGDIHTFNLKTGKHIWTKHIGMPVTYIYTGEKWIYGIGGHGKISKLSALDGKISWQDSVSGRVVASPFVLGDSLFIQTSNKAFYGIHLG